MSKKPVIPDKSFGGTFVYDKDGVLLEHQPPTQPRALVTPEANAEPATGDAASADAANDKSSAKRGK
jgi:hypothetical protein